VAVAADFFRSGRKDIAVVSYLPADHYRAGERVPLASILSCVRRRRASSSATLGDAPAII